MASVSGDAVIIKSITQWYKHRIGRSLLSTSLFSLGICCLIGVALILVVTFYTAKNIANERTSVQLNELIESMQAMAGIACFTDDQTLATETATAFIQNSIINQIQIYHDNHHLADVARKGFNAIAEKNEQIRRPVYSPFDKEDIVGEIIVTPNQQEIQKQVDTSVHSAILITFILVIVIFSMLTIALMVFVINPVRLISNKLHVMDAVSGELVELPHTRFHQHNELGQLVDDINELITRLLNALKFQHEQHLEQVVAEKTRLSSEVFENTQEAILITDAENKILTVNPAFTRITGYSESDVLGQDPRILSSQHHDKAFFEQMWRELKEIGFWRGELWNRCKDGSIKPKWISITTIKDADGHIINHIGLFSDITERKMAEERIDFLAHHDALTSLPNRILIRDRFVMAQAQAKRNGFSIAVLFIDLDNFKSVNDTFGHQVGDRLLLQAVQRLRDIIRESDSLSRQGGDEFLIILPTITEESDVSRVAQSIIHALSTPFEIDEHALSVSASIGIAIYPKDGHDFDALLKNSDMAMYEAKSLGKNSYRFFTEELNIDVQRKVKIKACLRTALENNEFKLYYQPQINLKTGELMGVESLIRWFSPDLGFVPPDHFIPLAEESGLINAIGEWVIDEACRVGRAWLDRGNKPMIFAVNVAAQQFNRSNLYDTVRHVLEKSAYPAELLELEFTESGLLNEIANSVSTIEELKSLGIKTAIDDFGTGYSSLSYLKQFKVGKLKIDRSFICDLKRGSEDLEIVRAIIQLGKTLDLCVIAEGVETKEHALLLSELNCDEIQGYLIAKPMTEADLLLWFNNWQEECSYSSLFSLS